MDGSRFASRDGGKFSGALPAHSQIRIHSDAVQPRARSLIGRSVPTPNGALVGKIAGMHTSEPQRAAVERYYQCSQRNTLAGCLSSAALNRRCANSSVRQGTTSVVPRVTNFDAALSAEQGFSVLMQTLESSQRLLNAATRLFLASPSANRSRTADIQAVPIA